MTAPASRAHAEKWKLAWIAFSFSYVHDIPCSGMFTQRYATFATNAGDPGMVLKIVLLSVSG